jgi:hypothetical protein
MARGNEYGQRLDWLELNTLASCERRLRGIAPNPNGAVQNLMEETQCVFVAVRASAGTSPVMAGGQPPATLYQEY